jgi:Tetracyclin repressor-like, C-terminal domain
VLRQIAAGLDWDKAGARDGTLRAERMPWSLVHGFAQLELNGRFRDGPALSVTDVMPAFGDRG